MPTQARDICNWGLEDLGVKAAGQAVSDSVLNVAFDRLNMMIDSWANENLMIYEITEESFDLTANDNDYSIGSSGDFDTVRPQEILKQGNFIRSGTTDYPLKVISLGQYRDIPNKSTTGIPFQLAYNPGFATGTIYLYYTPSSSDYDIYLRSLKELGEFALLATTVSFPPGYKRALIKNLAIEMAPAFGRKISPALAAAAEESKRVIKLRNTGRLEQPKLEVGQLSSGSSGDILTGWG